MAIAAVPSRLGGEWVTRQLERSDHGTVQSTLRLTVLLLVALLALAAWLGFDAVLGAFVGGMVFAAMLTVRGGAVLLWLRHDLDRTELVQAALYSTTTLPVLVALSGLAVDDGAISSNIGAAIVGAGVLSVIILPFVAGRLSGAHAEAAAAPSGATESDSSAIATVDPGTDTAAGSE